MLAAAVSLEVVGGIEEASASVTVCAVADIEAIAIVLLADVVAKVADFGADAAEVDLVSIATVAVIAAVVVVVVGVAIATIVIVSIATIVVIAISAIAIVAVATVAVRAVATIAVTIAVAIAVVITIATVWLVVIGVPLDSGGGLNCDGKCCAKFHHLNF